MLFSFDSTQVFP